MGDLTHLPENKRKRQSRAGTSGGVADVLGIHDPLIKRSSAADNPGYISSTQQARYPQPAEAQNPAYEGLKTDSKLIFRIAEPEKGVVVAVPFRESEYTGLASTAATTNDEFVRARAKRDLRNRRIMITSGT